MEPFKFDGPTPDVIKDQEAEARRKAVEDFLKKGGSVEECPPVPTPRINTAR